MDHCFRQHECHPRYVARQNNRVLNTDVEYDLNGQRDETLSETIFDFAIDDADNYSQSNCSQDEPCLEISIGEEVMFNIEGSKKVHKYFTKSDVFLSGRING